jgi:hypothetical protein
MLSDYVTLIGFAMLIFFFISLALEIVGRFYKSPKYELGATFFAIIFCSIAIYRFQILEDWQYSVILWVAIVLNIIAMIGLVIMIRHGETKYVDFIHGGDPEDDLDSWNK